MSGKIRTIIDEIVNQRSKGDETIADLTKTKLILKGIDVDKYNQASQDDPNIIESLQTIAKEFNVTL